MCVLQEYDVLSNEDILNLYKSKNQSNTTAKCFITRSIFNIAFVTSWGPGALASTAISQVICTSQDDERVCLVQSRTKIQKGSKTTRRGLNAVNDKL